MREMVGYPTYSSYNPASISVGGVPCPPLLTHNLPQSAATAAQVAGSAVYPHSGTMQGLRGHHSTRESVMAQIRASIPNPPVLSRHRPHHQQQQPPTQPPSQHQQVSSQLLNQRAWSTPTSNVSLSMLCYHIVCFRSRECSSH